MDTLDPVLSDALALLQEGAANPGSAWRNLALATMGLDGVPRARTVVLRRFEAPRRWLEMHTDTRSAKYAELSANAGAALHGWDAKSHVQLRVTGRVSLHVDDAVADAAWGRLRPQSQATYRALPGPGSPLPSPDATGMADEAAARSVFCVIRLAMDELDWLRLGQDRHRRARFTWESGHVRGAWLTP